MTTLHREGLEQHLLALEVVAMTPRSEDELDWPEACATCYVILPPLPRPLHVCACTRATPWNLWDVIAKLRLVLKQRPSALGVEVRSE